MTNGQKIKGMTNEELSQLFVAWDLCIDNKDCDRKCIKCWENWLNSEFDEAAPANESAVTK